MTWNVYYSSNIISAHNLSNTWQNIINDAVKLLIMWLFLTSEFLWVKIFDQFELPVRGMMYYRKALELQSFLDIASDEGINYIPFSEMNA